MVELDNPALSAGAAGMQLRLDIPIFGSFRQFSLYILALKKQCFRTPFYQRFREADQLV
jgi:hypothetical protein